jgi:hypothetical protein
MIEFILNLKVRNECLFQFGTINFILALFFLGLTKYSNMQLNNISAWFKPFKFASSIGLYSWTMAWYCFYLPNFNIILFNYSVIILLGFEIIYIALQASKGQLSHFNISTPLYSTLFFFMGFAASVISAYTGFVGYLFFIHQFPELPEYYVWAIRLGIIIFVVFSFEGFLMGSRLSHTIGGKDGSPGIPILNWSKKFGDPRIAHFIGMHALQVLPFLAFYFLKNTYAVFIISILYGLLATFTLAQAIKGKPLFKESKKQIEERE